MASIRKEILIDALPEDVWDALRDWGAIHRRLVPGFVVDARLDGEDRIVTFFNGFEAREVLVDLDDEARRLVWSLVEGPYTHHNGVAQVFDEGEGRSRFVWTARPAARRGGCADRRDDGAGGRGGQGDPGARGCGRLRMRGRRLQARLALRR
jgi:hypothetical protein